MSDFKDDNVKAALISEIQCNAGIDTYKHSINVARIMMIAARTLGLKEERVIEYGLMGLFHDTGKIMIPNEVLDYAGIYDEKQRELVRSHSSMGATILQQIGTPQIIVDGAALHHETALENDLRREIRILAAADIYEALRSHRVYHPVKSHEVVKSILDQNILEGKVDETAAGLICEIMSSDYYPEPDYIDTVFEEILDEKGWEAMTCPINDIYRFKDLRPNDLYYRERLLMSV